MPAGKVNPNEALWHLHQELEAERTARREAEEAKDVASGEAAEWQHQAHWERDRHREAEAARRRAEEDREAVREWLRKQQAWTKEAEAKVAQLIAAVEEHEQELGKAVRHLRVADDKLYARVRSIQGDSDGAQVEGPWMEAEGNDLGTRYEDYGYG